MSSHLSTYNCAPQRQTEGRKHKAPWNHPEEALIQSVGDRGRAMHGQTTRKKVVELVERRVASAEMGGRNKGNPGKKHNAWILGAFSSLFLENHGPGRVVE